MLATFFEDVFKRRGNDVRLPISRRRRRGAGQGGCELCRTIPGTEAFVSSGPLKDMAGIAKRLPNWFTSRPLGQDLKPKQHGPGVDSCTASNMNSANYKV